MKKLTLGLLALILIAVTPAFAGGGDAVQDTFFAAVRRGDVDAAKNYLDTQEASINDQDGAGNTGLIIAVSQDDLNMVLALVPYAPDLEVTNNEGKTALDVANERGNVAIQGALNGL
jgi:ankyrin repeat protein